ATHTFGHQDSHHTRRPDHPGRMKLHKLHVDQIRPRVISECVTVASVFPAVTGDFVGPPNSASGQHDRFGTEDLEASAFAFVTKRPDDAVAVLKKRKNRVLHMDIDATMHTVILQSANHLQARAIAHVREPWIFMPAKVSLENSAVFGPIKHGAP